MASIDYVRFTKFNICQNSNPQNAPKFLVFDFGIWMGDLGLLKPFRCKHEVHFIPRCKWKQSKHTSSYLKLLQTS